MEDLDRRLYCAAAVRELDRRAVERQGIAGYTLMQGAAAAAWHELQRRWPAAERIVVVCGNGNNGGDGYVLARLAQAAGRRVGLFAVGGAPARGDAVRAHADWLAAGGQVAPLEPRALEGAEVVVDALLGIGLARPVEGRMAEAIAVINAAGAGGAGILALDLPSGLDSDSGQVRGAAVRADLTVCFIARKLGLYTAEGPAQAGTLVIADLAVPAAVHDGLRPEAQRLDAADLRAWLAPRRRTAHKGRHGHVLVVGGDHGMAGAALMAGRAALRAGAGLVSVATRSRHAAALAAAQPELMVYGVDTAAELAPLLARASVVAVGPGLGLAAWGRALFGGLLDGARPLVVDADALNLLALEPTMRRDWILTPHPGEAARLLGCSTAAVQADRLAALRTLEQRYGGVVVLKGSGSLISAMPPYCCPYGNPGMAVGGMGDALTGIIAALVAQGLLHPAAAAAGTLVHALAGDRAAAAGERGLLPSDLIAELRHYVNPVVLP